MTAGRRPTDSVIGALLAAWEDLDRLLEVVPDTDAVRQPGAGRASVAWAVGHLASQIDTWINVGHARLPADVLLADARWAMGGDGQALEWHAIRDAMSEARRRAEAYLADRAGTELDERGRPRRSPRGGPPGGQLVDQDADVYRTLGARHRRARLPADGCHLGPLDLPGRQ